MSEILPPTEHFSSGTVGSPIRGGTPMTMADHQSIVGDFTQAVLYSLCTLITAVLPQVV